MNLEQYLNRIGIGKIYSPSYEFLAELQLKHLCSIPFEDLDIPDRGRIILDIERIYKKIIPTKRGGFCYELNGLFHWLLTQVGFKVDMLSARVYNHIKQELGPEFDHMTLLVHLDKNYLVDAGFGDSFRKPIALPVSESEDVSGRYKLNYVGGNVYQLLKLESRLVGTNLPGKDKLNTAESPSELVEEGKLQYQFTTEPRKFSDYEAMCAFQQDDLNSHFRTRMLCTIATPSGRITLSNNSLTITENGNKSKTEFDSEKEFLLLLKKYFGIELT
ncbi:MAG: arylamine N-acetyltransferase [Bacteroidota bacterium]